jgi:hypothetical protein
MSFRIENILTKLVRKFCQRKHQIPTIHQGSYSIEVALDIPDDLTLGVAVINNSLP